MRPSFVGEFSFCHIKENSQKNESEKKLCDKLEVMKKRSCGGCVKTPAAQLITVECGKIVYVEASEYIIDREYKNSIILVHKNINFLICSPCLKAGDTGSITASFYSCWIDD